MVLIKRICPPERRKATIAVSAAPSSPTLSVNAPEDPDRPFQLRISLRIADTTIPGKAITIVTNGTVFDPSDLDSGYDIISRGTAGLRSASDPERRINLGRFLVHYAREDNPSPDLKERPRINLLTIPAEGAVEVAHDLPVSRMFKHETRLSKEDVIGEDWQLVLSDGHVGCSWWCWGDLDGELKEKRLASWHEAVLWASSSAPNPEADGEWVLGSDPVELVFEDNTEDAVFRFTK